MVLYFRDFFKKKKGTSIWAQSIVFGIFSINLKDTFARHEKSLTFTCQSITLRTAGEFHF